MVALITTVTVLLLVFVTFVFLCFVFSQKWHRGRTGHDPVHDRWRRLIESHRAQTL